MNICEFFGSPSKALRDIIFPFLKCVKKEKKKVLEKSAQA